MLHNVDFKVILASVFSTYSEEDRLKILAGCLLTDESISVPYFERLTSSRLFTSFCKLFHDKALTVVDAIKRGDDRQLVLSSLFAGRDIVDNFQELENSPTYYVRMFGKLFVQYLSVRTLKANATDVDEDRISELIKVASEFPKAEAKKTLTVLASREALFKYLREASPLIYETKFETLNHILGGGLRSKRLYVVGGSSGVGKSHFLIDFFIDACSKRIKSIYITIENSAEESQHRVLSNLTEIDSTKLFIDSPGKEKYIEEKLSQVESVVKTLRENGRIIEAVYCTVADVERELKKHRPKIVFIDYLNIMTHNVMRDNRARDLEDLTLCLHRLAVAYDIAIVTACQQNREAVRMNNPDEATVGESFGIVKASDMFFILYHPKFRGERNGEDDDNKPEIILKVSKSRISRKTKIFLKVRKDISKFREMTLEEIEETIERMRPKKKDESP